MAQSFFWYDLETSGLSPREQRIMQFAGQRTDLDLNPIGDPVNVLIKLGEDILPDPDAILVTGITPQSTLHDGITEAEFCKLFFDQVATPNTIFVGYNTVRFDDEFMRFLLWRNFYDAYEWQWQDGRSRWDLLDVVRMTRALRPAGINWPVKDGKPTNRLELITKLNGVEHENAHDALADVVASIAVARLIKTKQPKLFDWLLRLRSKNEIKKFIEENQTFMYSSGHYSSDVEKTAVVRMLHVDDTQSALVYDLRFDPTDLNGLSPEALADRWRFTKDPVAPPRLPVKTLKYNHCPALSPTGILSDKDIQERLKVTPEIVNANLIKLRAMPELVVNIVKARDLLDDERGELWSRRATDADAALYDGFVDEADKRISAVVRAANGKELMDYVEKLTDRRLKDLLPRYKARNFLSSLSDEERAEWEKYRYHTLVDGGKNSRVARFMHRLGQLAESTIGQEDRFLIEELQLYAESIMPVMDVD
ncbi:MAG TPA: exodeoxyribonuclease I [Verrucomicrobiae bacterium]|nr:exodeoxyribonuclease I [Verrucomicrobiae bacterium]